MKVGAARRSRPPNRPSRRQIESYTCDEDAPNRRLISLPVNHAQETDIVRGALKFSVPRFLTDGAYKTNMDFFTFAPAFGGGVYVAAGDILGTGQVQTVVYGKGAVGPAFTSVDGTDRFGLSGFISTNQAVNLSGDHTGFFGSFTGGVRVVAGDFFGDGSVTYITSDSFGNIVRTGQTGQTSRVNFERGDATIFKFTFGTQFRGGVFVTASDVNR